MDNLELVNISDSVKTIGAEAFFDCNNLKRIKIPSTVKIINRYALGCLYYIFGVALYSENYIIHGIANSAAEEYAREYGIEFSEEELPLFDIGFSDETLLFQTE